MFYDRLSRLIFIFTFSYLVFSLWAVTSFATDNLRSVDELEKIIKNFKSSGKIVLPQEMPKSDRPEYPVYKILEGLKIELEKENYAEVILLLEGQRERLLYQGSFDRGVRESYAYLTTFKLWRELAYLILGRSYYMQKNYQQSISNYQGVPIDSIFYVLSKLGESWSLLALGKLQEVQQLIQNIKQAGNNDYDLASEIEIVSAFLEMRKGNYTLAENIAGAVLKNVDKIPYNLQLMLFKITSEAKFHQWVDHNKEWDFNTNRTELMSVIENSKKVPVELCDSECKFFIAEAWWNLASIYRIENPEKYQKEWSAALTNATQMLRGMVENTIRQKRPLISEEGYFLFLASLIEKNDVAVAEPYLRQFSNFYPLGQYREDVHQLLGDFYFEKGEHQKAIEQFRELVKVGGDEKSAYGIYKAAWSFYNEKKTWEALRHLERLLLHYQKQQKEEGSKTSSILKEAERDMLLFLAELMPPLEAIKEIEIFHYSDNRYYQVLEELARIYKKIGKFDESSVVFKKIFIDNSKCVAILYSEIKAYTILYEMLDNELRMGRRERVAKELRENYPLVCKGETLEDPSEFYKKLTQLTLTMHREAKKLENNDHWPSVDKLYSVWNELLSDTKVALLWYHGAQRYEQKGEQDLAILSYEKAALSPQQQESFENRLDAAHSVLNILRKKSDNLSILSKEQEKKIELPFEHTKIIEHLKWYITHFPEAEGRDLADLLLLEHLCKRAAANDYEEIKTTLIDLFNSKGDSQKQQNKLMKVLFYYKERNFWKNTYILVDELSQLSSKFKDQKFKEKILLTKQESAFQYAFTLKGEEARSWYAKSLESSVDPLLKLKAIHNLIMSYEWSSEIEKLQAAMEKYFADNAIFIFENKEEKTAQEIQEVNDMLFSLKMRKGNIYQHLGDYSKAAASILSAIELNPNQLLLTPEQKDKELFNLLLTYGQYRNKQQFLKILKELQKQNSAQLQILDNKIVLARLLFWNNLLRDAWDLLSVIIETEIIPTYNQKKNYAPDSPQYYASYLLLNDLYYVVTTTSDALKPKVDTFLKKHQQELIPTSTLTPLWGTLFHKDYNKENPVWGVWTKSIPTTTTTPTIIEIIKGTLDQIANKIKVITKFSNSPSLEVRADAICALSNFRQEALNELEQAKNHPEMNQWKGLAQKLTDNIQNFLSLLQKEQAACATLKAEAKFVPLISTYITPNKKPLLLNKESEAAAFQLPALSNHQQRLKQVEELLDQQEYALAEKVVLNEYKNGNDNSEEFLAMKSYLLALIRLAHHDTYNASLLLKFSCQDKSIQKMEHCSSL
ncbi:MAG: hypothetical protein HQK50_06030 [Oligoflexia bacterium]|nr:hypothetical protein [Oligoflexia bacterium]MBF0365109.1 hypothetical protein [Oligoflexia bacterium]